MLVRMVSAVPVLSVALWGGAVPAASPVVAAGVSANPPAVGVRTESVVKRHRPGFIWRFFGNGHGGNGGGNGGNGGNGGSPQDCAGLPAGGPAAPIIVGRLQPLRLCFRGFAPGDQPVLHVFTPGGGQLDRPGRSFGPAGWAWDWAAAPLPTGTYRFTITAAGTPDTTGLIVVRPATEPDAVFSYREPLQRGDQVTVTAVGHRPGTPIYATLYGPAQADRRLGRFRDLPRVIADDNGEGVLRWTVGAAVRPGTYGILVESPTGEEQNCRTAKCDQFEVGR